MVQIFRVDILSPGSRVRHFLKYEWVSSPSVLAQNGISLSEVPFLQNKQVYYEG